MNNQLALFYLQKTAEKRGSKLRFKRLFLAWSIYYTSENKHKNSAICKQVVDIRQGQLYNNGAEIIRPKSWSRSGNHRKSKTREKATINKGLTNSRQKGGVLIND